MAELLLKPTKAEIAAAEGKSVGDVIAPELDVLFCGINPGLYSGATGRHFARPGNRFWRTLHASGFTGRLLSPHEDRGLLAFSLGITNFVERSTATADKLTKAELVAGTHALRAKCARFRPRYLAILGISAFRTAYAKPKAIFGPQPETIAETAVWVLPNPSGLNAHFTPDRLAQVFKEFREAISSGK